MTRIYLDNNATTPIDPRLYDLFVSCTFTTFGNPSSIHGYGQEARAYLIKARDDIARLFGVRSQEIIFTATATEALNMLLRGFFGSDFSGHMITSSVEHPAVYATCQYLESRGVEVTYLAVGPYGAPKPEELKAAIKSNTRLICLMAANNETGVETDINQMAEIAISHKIPFIVDGVSLLGKEIFSKLHPGISAICFSGHKCYAPKGAAFAIVRKGFKLQPHLTGGHQEHGIRAGTENLASIVTMAKALEYLVEESKVYLEPLRALRDYFEDELKKRFEFVTINGTGPRIANTSNVCFQDVDGEALLMYLDLQGVAASLGSACSSGALEPSRVLLNMGLTRKQALASIRFSLSRYTTRQEIDQTLQILSQALNEK
ncbi:MAG: cysteine desulfurase [Chlamydiales bacterium]|nr:cysteine desulfurase [Chlamydiales bacterium]